MNRGRKIIRRSHAVDTVRLWLRLTEKHPLLLASAVTLILVLVLTPGLPIQASGRPAPIYQVSSPLVPGFPGKAFAVTSSGNGNISMNWQTGAGVASLRIIRRSSDPDLTLPVPSPAATSATDTLPVGLNVACYQLEGLDAIGRVAARSDLLCVVVRLTLGSGPSQISVEADQSTSSTVRWSAAPGATSYIFLPLGTNRVQLLPAQQTFGVDPTGANPTCYIVGTQSTAGISGISDVACAIPGAWSGL